jgi:hypothetical protein
LTGPVLALFQPTLRGRAFVAMAGVFMGTLLLPLTSAVPAGRQRAFLVMLALAALFIPFAAPNVISSVHDMTSVWFGESCVSERDVGIHC